MNDKRWCPILGQCRLAMNGKKEDMQLVFLKGDEQMPRGHAIAIVRPYMQPERALATYCIVLPIQFSLNRYLPPIIASQLPLDSRDLSMMPSAMPVPPMLEDVADLDELLRIAELRDDDVIEVSGVDLSNEARRMELGAEICNEYNEIYARYTLTSRATRAPTIREQVVSTSSPSLPNDTFDSLLGEPEAVSDREMLGEVARQLGSMRDALTSSNPRQVDDAKKALLRATAPLSEKYRPSDLLNAAIIPGERGQRLAELLLTRAYKLADEDYQAIPPIEEAIRKLQD
jgi:hypothetical protein